MFFNLLALYLPFYFFLFQLEIESKTQVNTQKY